MIARMARPSSRPSPYLLPLLLVVVLAGAGVAISIKIRQQENEITAEEPTQPRSTPFDDLPPEERPERTRRESDGGPSLARRTMPNLSANPLAADEGFQAALEEAQRAEALFQEAVAALEASEHSTFREKGGQAQQLFEHALESTEAYQTSLEALHGETDPDVRGIAKARGFWQDRRLFLHKMIP